MSSDLARLQKAVAFLDLSLQLSTLWLELLDALGDALQLVLDLLELLLSLLYFVLHSVSGQRGKE